jgi:hypothetical protein
METEWILPDDRAASYIGEDDPVRPATSKADNRYRASRDIDDARPAQAHAARLVFGAVR